MKIVMQAVSKLSPYANNSRTHSESQVAAIAASIKEFGFTNPILVGEDGVVIAGHGRLAAAMLIDLEKVPTIVLGNLTDEQRRALVIADNKLAEQAGWDEAILAQELAALSDAGYGLTITGFSDKEVAALLAQLEEDTTGLRGDPDAAPDVPETPVTAIGDMWALGDHRLVCGDATSVDVLKRLCAEEGQISALWTDPPYNVNYEGSAGKILNDCMSSEKFAEFLVCAFTAAASVLAPGAAAYVAHADTEGLAFRQAFAEAGFKLSGCLVWVKPSLVLGRSDYQWRHEPILYGWKRGASHTWLGGRANTTVQETTSESVRILKDGSVQVDIGDQTIVITGVDMQIAAVDGSVVHVDRPAHNKVHPTMKPVDLITGFLRNSVKRGGSVLDPFGGSGSTLMACELIGRRAFLTELEPKFCDVIINRWQEATGKKARLDGTEKSYADVKRDRDIDRG